MTRTVVRNENKLAPGSAPAVLPGSSSLHGSADGAHDRAQWSECSLFTRLSRNARFLQL